MKKPLQHRILDLLSVGPQNFNQLCDQLSPHHTNRNSITSALQAMKYDGKVRVCGHFREGRMGAIAIWELAPAVSNALSECWPMPVDLPVPGTVREHRGQM